LSHPAWVGEWTVEGGREEIEMKYLVIAIVCFIWGAWTAHKGLSVWVAIIGAMPIALLIGFLMEGT
jgi:hypothetical protein